MKDKISVIVPCYNVQKYIMRCFESIYNQTYGFENLEVIFVDDLSEDNTWSILESLQKRYKENVISVRMKKKGLAGGSRNVGLDLATGEYIAFVDADDCIHPQMLEILYDKLKEEDFDVVQCMAKNFSSESIETFRIDQNPQVILKLNDMSDRKNLILRCTGGNNMAVWGKLYSHSFLKENRIRFLEKVYYEDDFFSILCIVLAKKYCVIDTELIYYFKNSEGITQSELSFGKIRDLPKVSKYLLDELQRRKVAENYFYEIQALIIWKSYFYALGLLEESFKREKSYYVDNILSLYDKEDVLNSPYITNIMDEELLKKLEYLKG